VNYKKRNTIVIGIFVLLVGLTGGYFVFYNFPKKINKIKTEIQGVDQKIAALQGLEEEIAEVKTILDDQKSRLKKLDKQLVVSGSPAETYRYINSIMNYSGVLKVDLLYLTNKATDNFMYDSYRIKGEGFFPTIYKFLWYLERGPQIYKIKKVSFHGVENREIDSTRTNIIVPFEIEFWAVYTELEDVPPINRGLNNVNVSWVRNPFLPFIYRNLPLNSENLLEVERSELKGILPGKAFIEDQTDKIHVLEEGAKVYLGYVSKIDVENNQVVFILNKGGIIEKYILKLGFE
jgi:hypothetical protein